MKARKYILIAVLFSMLVACTEELKVIPYTYPQVLTGETSKSWVLRSVQIVQKGKGTPSFRLADCVMDDVYTFYNNSERSYQITDGANKCSPGDPNLLVDSNWSFVNTTATLTIVLPVLSDNPLPFVLSEVDNSKFVIDIYLDDDFHYRFNFRSATE